MNFDCERLLRAEKCSVLLVGFGLGILLALEPIGPPRQHLLRSLARGCVISSEWLPKSTCSKNRALSRN